MNHLFPNLIRAKRFIFLLGLVVAPVFLHAQTPKQKRLVQDVQEYYDQMKTIIVEIDKVQDRSEPIEVDGRRYDVIVLDGMSLSNIKGPYPKLSVKLYFELLKGGRKSPYKLLMASVSKMDVPMHSLYQEYLFKDDKLCFAYDHENCCGEMLKYYKGNGVEYIYSEDPEEEISQESIEDFKSNTSRLVRLFETMVEMFEFVI